MPKYATEARHRHAQKNGSEWPVEAMDCFARAKVFLWPLGAIVAGSLRLFLASKAGEEEGGLARATDPRLHPSWTKGKGDPHPGCFLWAPRSSPFFLTSHKQSGQRTDIHFKITKNTAEFIYNSDIFYNLENNNFTDLNI